MTVHLTFGKPAYQLYSVEYRCDDVDQGGFVIATGSDQAAVIWRMQNNKAEHVEPDAIWRVDVAKVEGPSRALGWHTEGEVIDCEI